MRRLAGWAFWMLLLILLPSTLNAGPGGTLPGLEAIRSLIENGRYLEAEYDLHESLPRAEAQFGPDSPEVAAILDLFVEGRLRAGRASHSETLDAARRAVALRESNPGSDPGALASSLSRLARVLEAHGHASAGNRHYRGMAEAREKEFGESSPAYISMLTVLAVSCMELGDAGTAAPLFERALRLAEAYLDPADPQTARIQTGLAWVAIHRGDASETSDRISRAERIYKAVFAGEPLRLARAHASLGDLLLQAGAPADADDQLEKALALLETAAGDSLLEGRCLGRLAAIALEKGELAPARRRIGRALALLEPSADVEPAELAALLTVSARIYDGQRDPAAAQACYERAHALYASALGAASPEAAATLSRLSENRAGRGDVTGALDAALHAEEIDRIVIQEAALALPERQALLAATARSEGLRIALSLATRVAPGDARRICDALIRSRGRVLDELAIRNRTISGTSSPVVARLYDDFAAANAAYAKAKVHSLQGSAASSGAPESLERERERAEAALAERSLVFRRDRIQSRAGYDEVHDALPVDAALVSYVRTDPTRTPATSRYLAFVMRRDRPDPLVVPLGDAEPLERLIGDWGREVLRGGASDQPDETRYRAVGSRLREAIWDPLVATVAGLDRVFIVPDGALHRVSFAAFPVRKHGYLIESGPTIHYLSSERDLVAPHSASDSGGLLLVGGATFDATPSPVEAPKGDLALGRIPFRGERPDCAALNKIRFENLPASRAEIEAIAGMWSRRGGNPPTVVRLVGEKASEGAFKLEAPGKCILHVATHGFFVSTGTGASAVPGVRGLGTLGVAASTPPENPLSLAGLALAGANLRDQAPPDAEDGILTAEEIAALDLHGVRWAVLSACDTGLGDVRSDEGVFGLRRAFQVAGVETLIMSLWPVDDEAARRWMEALYAARLFRERDTAQAVRDAGLEVLRENRIRGSNSHPFFWGGFVATGDWR